LLWIEKMFDAMEPQDQELWYDTIQQGYGIARPDAEQDLKAEKEQAQQHDEDDDEDDEGQEQEGFGDGNQSGQEKDPSGPGEEPEDEGDEEEETSGRTANTMRHGEIVCSDHSGVDNAKAPSKANGGKQAPASSRNDLKSPKKPIRSGSLVKPPLSGSAFTFKPAYPTNSKGAKKTDELKFAAGLHKGTQSSKSQVRKTRGSGIWGRDHDEEYALPWSLYDDPDLEKITRDDRKKRKESATSESQNQADVTTGSSAGPIRRASRTTTRASTSLMEAVGEGDNESDLDEGEQRKTDSKRIIKADGPEGGEQLRTVKKPKVAPILPRVK
jgi:hypothetical protein